MKNLKILLILLIFLAVSFTTDAQDCNQSTAQFDLDVNNVRARLNTNGSLWWDGNSRDGRYIYPKVTPGSGLPEVVGIFGGGIWVGGKDESGNLLLATAKYGQAFGQIDYFPGPLDENGETDQLTCGNWDLFFTVSSQAINAHISDFQDNGMIDYTVPNSILGWPGRGNSNFINIHSFEMPNSASPLAPFIDVNNNGIYDPMLGDYPDTKFADQAIWWVFNDNGGVHTETLSTPLGFEFQMMAYAYSSADPAINDATFYDLTMINKSTRSVVDLYTSVWADYDLGCYEDDFMGCVPEENLAYVYNQDDTDGQGCDCQGQGINSYCEEIPVIGIKLLKGMESFETGSAVDLGMTSFVYYENGAFDATPGTIDPQTAQEHYNYMQGLWQDGTPLSFGGTGYNPGAAPFAFAFPNSPNDPNGWSMCAANLPNQDRRVLINSGPVTSPPGAVHRLSFAVIAQEDVPHPCPDISGLVEIGNTVQDLFDNPITSTDNIVYNNNNLTIQPNPFSEQTNFTLKESSELIQSIKLYSIDGQLIRNLDNINENSYAIQRSDLNVGMYVYLLLTGDGKVMSGKVVVE